MPEYESRFSPSLVSADQDTTFNLLLYGDPGAGKTTMACQAQDQPDMANVLVANKEGGMLSVLHRGDIHEVRIDRTDDLTALAWELANGAFQSVRTLVVDNATEVQTVNLEEIVADAIQAGRNKVKNRDRTLDDVWQEDYGRSTVQLKRLFRFLRDLPINVVITAHAKRVYPRMPEGTDLTKVQPIAVMPSFTQKLGESVMGYMDFVWCLEQDTEEPAKGETKEVERFVVTTSKGLYRCKTRGPYFLEAIGDVVDNPYLPTLYDTFVRTAREASALPATPNRSKRKRA